MLEDIKSAHSSGFKESESDVGSTEQEDICHGWVWGAQRGSRFTVLGKAYGLCEDHGSMGNPCPWEAHLPGSWDVKSTCCINFLIRSALMCTQAGKHCMAQDYIRSLIWAPHRCYIFKWIQQNLKYLFAQNINGMGIISFYLTSFGL